mgnify:CR=1 FL=1
MARSLFLGFRSRGMHKFQRVALVEQRAVEVQALEVGAVPIVVDGPEHELLIGLDLGIVVLSAWAELPLFLLNVTREETEARGSKVRARWGAVKSGLRRHMLRAVCQLRP